MDPLKIRSHLMLRMSQMESHYVASKVMAYTYLVSMSLEELQTISVGSEDEVQEFVDEAKRNLHHVMNSPEMEFFDVAKILYSRIRVMESDLLSKKVIGNILSQGIQNNELHRLACASDLTLIDFIQKQKECLGLSPYPAGPVPCGSSSSSNLHVEENQLEVNILEILKSAGYGIRLSILQNMLYQRFHRSIRVDEDDLMKVLHHSRNLRVINRPGDEPVILLCECRKVFVTFDFGSRFTKEDVLNYFSTYGAIEEVLCYQMHCFVEFKMAETLNLVLVNGGTTSHFINGIKVLAKPYVPPTRKLGSEREE